MVPKSEAALCHSRSFGDGQKGRFVVVVNMWITQLSLTHVVPSITRSWTWQLLQWKPLKL